jgi:hypothetical protein
MYRPITQSKMTVLAAAALLLMWSALRVKAFNPQPDPPAFGMIGVDPSETVRLNAVCADGPLPGDVPPGPCAVTLVFRDSSGRALKQSTQTLLPGQGAFLDLRGAEATPPPDPDRIGRRTEVHPWIQPVGRGFIFATVEVFDDATGRVSAALNPTEPKSLGILGGL